MLRLALASALSLAYFSLIYWGAIFITRAYGFDSGQWGNVDPALRQWFNSLQTPGGGFCCDGADGVRIEDPAWKENADHSYEVFARERWNQIPPDRVLTGSNRVGYAILWWPPSEEKPTCFLPGSKG